MSKRKKSETSKTQKANKPANTLGNKFSRVIHHKYFALSFSFLFFVVMIIISYSYHKIGDYGVETDFYQSYVPLARDLLNGVLTIDSFKGPVYQILLSVVGFIFSDFFKAGIFIGVFSAAVFIYFTFELLRNLYSEKIALLAILFIAFNPTFIQYTYSAGTDMLFAALVMISFYYLFKSDNLNYKNLVAASFIGGIAYLTRYNGVFILGFVLIILFVNYWNINRRERIKSSSIFLGTFFLTIVPWGIYCLIRKGSFFFNENYKNIAYELYGRGRISWETFWYSPNKEFNSLSDVISKDPTLMLKTILGNIYANFVGDMGKLLGWYIGVLVIIGIVFYIVSDGFVIRKSRDDKKKLSYYLMDIFFFILLSAIFYSERFSLFLLPFYFVIVSYEFFERSFKVLKRYFEQHQIIKIPVLKSAMNLVIILLLSLSAYNTIQYNSVLINSGPREILRLRDWYLKNIPESERGNKIAARKPQVAYYLDMKFNVIPMADNLVQLLDYLKKNNDDYLFFSWFEAGTRPKLGYLLDSGPEIPGLERMVSFKEPPAVLYRVRKSGK